LEKVTNEPPEKQLSACLWSTDYLQGIPLRRSFCKPVNNLNDSCVKF